MPPKAAESRQHVIAQDHGIPHGLPPLLVGTRQKYYCDVIIGFHMCPFSRPSLRLQYYHHYGSGAPGTNTVGCY